MSRKISILLIIAVGPFWKAAYARSYDPTLWRLYDENTGKPDDRMFRDWAREIGLAVAPKYLGPAATLGSMGFEVSYGIGLTTINGSRDYWQKMSTSPGDVLVTNQIRIRKGLPYSLQISGLITHLFESGMWGVGLEVGGAVIEGFKYVPDFQLQASVGTLLGSGDVAMLNAGFATIMSKTFAIAGLFTLAPYAGYHLIYMNVGSYLTAKVSQTASGTEVKPFVLSTQNIFVHRALLGLGLTAAHFTAGVEFGLGTKQTSYSFKVGTSF